jgi:hypothetical protein
MGYARGQKKASRYSQLARFCCLGMAPMPVQASNRSGSEQDPLRPSDGLRPVVGTEFAVDIAGVNLDRVQGEEKLASIQQCLGIRNAEHRSGTNQFFWQRLHPAKPLD